MNTVSKTITQQIVTGKNLKISNKEIQLQQLVKLDNRNVLLLNVFTILSKYRYHLKNFIRTYKMNDIDATKYRYKPFMLSYNLYGTIELGYMLLSINHMTSAAEFVDLDQGVKLFTSDIIDFLNEMIIKEKTILTDNRTAIRKEIITL